jgi:hypothetical protein
MMEHDLEQAGERHLGTNSDHPLGSSSNRASSRGGRRASGGELLCPECLQGKLKRIPRDERPEAFIYVRAPLRCDACAAIVERPAGAVMCYLAIAVGLGFALGAVAFHIAPWFGYLKWIRGSDASLYDLIAGLVMMAGAVSMVRVGVGTRQYSAWYWKRVGPANRPNGQSDAPA